MTQALQINVDDAQLLTDALRASYHAATSLRKVTVASAFATARDAIDSGAMPPEVAAGVLLGSQTLAQALRDTASVQRDADEVTQECALFASQLELAAETIERCTC